MIIPNSSNHPRTAEELYYFLKLEGISETLDNCKNIIKHTIRPFPTLPHFDHFERIVSVWTNNNCRTVLWSNNVITRHNLMDQEYNYLDIGTYQYSGVLLLWDISDDDRVLIKTWFGKTDEYGAGKKHRLQSISGFLTKDEVLSQIQAIKLRQARDKERIDLANLSAQRKKGLLSSGNFKINGVSFLKDKIVLENLTIGVKGCPINRFIEVGDLESLEDGKINFNHLYRNMLDKFWWELELNNNRLKIIKGLSNGITVYCGKFPLSITFERKESKRYYIEDILMNKKNFDYALRRAITYTAKTNFISLLRNLRETPIEAQRLLEHGLTMTLHEVRELRVSPSAGLLTTKYFFDVIKLGSSYYLKAGNIPVHVRGGYQTILRFEQIVVFSKWDLFLIFSRYMDKQLVVDLIFAGEKEYLKVEEKSRELLNDVVSSNKHRVRETEATNKQGATFRGWIIQGEKNTYFLTADNQSFYYPSMDHICIHEITDHIAKPLFDKVASTMLALINDSKVVQYISTLKG